MGRETKKRQSLRKGEKKVMHNRKHSTREWLQAVRSFKVTGVQEREQVVRVPSS